MLNQQELLDKVKIYNNYIDENVVKKAYNFAFNVHRNQKFHQVSLLLLPIFINLARVQNLK